MAISKDLSGNITSKAFELKASLGTVEENRKTITETTINENGETVESTRSYGLQDMVVQIRYDAVLDPSAVNVTGLIKGTNGEPIANMVEVTVADLIVRYPTLVPLLTEIADYYNPYK